MILKEYDKLFNFYDSGYNGFKDKWTEDIRHVHDDHFIDDYVNNRTFRDYTILLLNYISGIELDAIERS